jgi:hypothetical protein
VNRRERSLRVTVSKSPAAGDVQEFAVTSGADLGLVRKGNLEEIMPAERHTSHIQSQKFCFGAITDQLLQSFFSATIFPFACTDTAKRQVCDRIPSLKLSFRNNFASAVNTGVCKNLNDYEI